MNADAAVCQTPTTVCRPDTPSEALCAVCRVSLQVGGPVPMPEKPEVPDLAWVTRPIRVEHAGVSTDSWFVMLCPDGQCSLDVYLMRRGGAYAAAVRITAYNDTPNPTDYVCEAYEVMRGSIAAQADSTALAPPEVEHVRAALRWCRAALALAEAHS